MDMQRGDLGLSRSVCKEPHKEAIMMQHNKTDLLY